ncbi:MAG: type 1 glutamine amidotransferase [Acidobacteria bacterium]|nr:type 1 glutamine amidotransferase [Acidobacteriota bacterium]
MRVAVSFLREDKLGTYLDAMRAAGLDAVPISPARRRGLEGLGGLVLTGGGDVDPSLYGAEPYALTKHVFRERDDLDRELIAESERKDLPILGICRGLQILNVTRGGTLHQHVEGHKETEHTVRPEWGSRMAAFVGTEDYTVNSRHHQAVNRLGNGLIVTARAEDGVIEAVEDPERRFVVAAQWHPEDRLGTRDFRIFSAFAKAVRGKL